MAPNVQSTWQHVDIYRPVAWMVAVILFLDSCNSLLRCTDDSECPRGGSCFKDECSRCLCPAGERVSKLYSDGVLSDICNPRPGLMTKVGEACNPNTRCPSGSHCDDVTKTCTCNLGLYPYIDNTYCRKGILGEVCNDVYVCDDLLWLTCEAGRCSCEPSSHTPTNWTQFILQRWDYSKVDAMPQTCITRAVGEPCLTNAECSSVEGSGAVCSLCGFCECGVSGHVPDVLGTKCGPALGPGLACSLISQLVCDGQRGLFCGDVCSLYSNDLYVREQRCTCSQMHDQVGEECVPKQIGSMCSTDLDCYPIQEGYGYCDAGRCTVNVDLPADDYMPFLSSRVCKMTRKKRIRQPPAPLDDLARHRDVSTFPYDTTSKTAVIYGVDGVQSKPKPVPILKTPLVQPTRLQGDSSVAVSYAVAPCITLVAMLLMSLMYVHR